MTAIVSACIKKLIKSDEFLHIHFNIEDGRKITFLACYTLLFQERKSTAETQRRIYAVCGEGAVTDGMCLKWCFFFLEIIKHNMLKMLPFSSIFDIKMAL